MKDNHKHGVRPTAELWDAALREVEAGVSARDVAQKYGVSYSGIYYRRRLMKNTGRNGMTREKLAALNDDIRAGVPASELRDKHLSVDKPPPMSPEQISRVINILTKIGEKYPEVFTELGIQRLLARYPMVLMEMI